MVEKTNWFSGVAVISLLIGIFMVARVSLNIATYSTYPTFGALPLNLNFTPIYTQTESDCEGMMPYPVASNDPAYNPQQQAQQAQYDKENCLRSVKEQRVQIEYTDITLAVFFTFLGLGMLLLRKFLPRIF